MMTSFPIRRWEERCKRRNLGTEVQCMLYSAWLEQRGYAWQQRKFCPSVCLLVKKTGGEPCEPAGIKNLCIWLIYVCKQIRQLFSAPGPLRTAPLCCSQGFLWHLPFNCWSYLNRSANPAVNNSQNLIYYQTWICIPCSLIRMFTMRKQNLLLMTDNVPVG